MRKINKDEIMNSLSIFPSVPEDGIKDAINLMKTGKFYRYSCSTPEESEVALFEKAIAEYTGAKYALAVNSCGSALYISLLALGVKPNDKVLCCGFTYTACPSAIVNTGAIPVLIECDENYCTDLDDLRAKITDETKVFLISHMRGNVTNMDEVKRICDESSVLLIEDCAHSLGSTYNGIHTGLFGKAGCFSTQSHKMINSGEGGFLITDDDELMAKAILYAGSQETFWQRHFINTEFLSKYQEYIPNISARMSNLNALILHAQLKYVDEWVEIYKRNYYELRSILSKSQYLFIPEDIQGVHRGQDTIQFNLVNFSETELNNFLKLMADDGIVIKVFGAKGNPRFFKSWRYIKDIENIQLPKTERILKFACDLRLPLKTPIKNISVIGEIILGNITKVKD